MREWDIEVSQPPIYHLRRLVYQYRSLESKARLEGDSWTANGHAAATRLFEAEVRRMEGNVKPAPAPDEDVFRGFRG